MCLQVGLPTLRREQLGMDVRAETVCWRHRWCGLRLCWDSCKGSFVARGPSICSQTLENSHKVLNLYYLREQLERPLSEALGIRTYPPVLELWVFQFLWTWIKGKSYGEESSWELYAFSSTSHEMSGIVLRTLQYQGRGNGSNTYCSGGFVIRLVKCIADPARLPSKELFSHLRARVSFSLSSLHAHRRTANLSDNTDLQRSGRAQCIATFWSWRIGLTKKNLSWARRLNGNILKMAPQKTQGG